MAPSRQRSSRARALSGECPLVMRSGRRQQQCSEQCYSRQMVWQFDIQSVRFHGEFEWVP